MPKPLGHYAQSYRENLTKSVIPFWLNHSLDRECGGYFTCMDRDGSVYDPRKYMWPQARQVWMFARLFNQFDRREEYLDAATLGLDFIRKYGRDEQGRVYFSLTREGSPFFFQRKPYGAVFFVMALIEYAIATGEDRYLDEAKAMFADTVRWLDDAALLGRPNHAGQTAVSVLANHMVLAFMVVELMAACDDGSYRPYVRRAIDGIVQHLHDGIFLEHVATDGFDLRQYPEGRLFNPGHSIECAWFLLHLLRIEPNEEHQRIALDVIEQTLVRGWDQQYGGLTYFVDIDGNPPAQLEAPMKLWWPCTEALYALVLAHTLTGEARFADWLHRVHEYTWSHFVDPEHGEWFGYLDREGRLTHTLKGSAYKGCFHVPRCLLMCVQEIERQG